MSLSPDGDAGIMQDSADSDLSAAGRIVYIIHHLNCDLNGYNTLPLFLLDKYNNDFSVKMHIKLK